MNLKLWKFVAGLAMAALWAVPAGAQMSEVKEKAPMYTYVADWTIPRAQWGEMDKYTVADQKLVEKAFASGTIVAYGDDVNLIHTVDGPTHDSWWSAMSMAAVIDVLEQAYKTGSATSPVLSTATKHTDNLYVSRYYNWHSGSWKGIYSHGASYTLKKDAPPDALDLLSKTLIVPLLEKMLADGAIHEYEIDTQAVHTEAPGTFYVFYIAANADGLDKVSAALTATLKANPWGTPVFDSMVDFADHRDVLVRTNAVYK